MPVVEQMLVEVTGREPSRDLKAEKAVASGRPLPPFPDAELEPLVDNTWGDTGKAIVNNWLGLVYGLTSVDRHQQFMPEVDPADPLGLAR